MDPAWETKGGQCSEIQVQQSKRKAMARLGFGQHATQSVRAGEGRFETKIGCLAVHSCNANKPARKWLQNSPKKHWSGGKIQGRQPGFPGNSAARTRASPSPAVAPRVALPVLGRLPVRPLRGCLVNPCRGPLQGLNHLNCIGVFPCFCPFYSLCPERQC
jgi:hypothetical protein